MAGHRSHFLDVSFAVSAPEYCRRDSLRYTMQHIQHNLHMGKAISVLLLFVTQEQLQSIVCMCTLPEIDVQCV